MISIRKISKRFNSFQVLSDFDLEVNEGETLVVLGRSGVGKSVLLKHIIGILKPDAGEVDVDGVKISSLYGPRLYHAVRHMGMLFQGAALFDSMTVEENIAFYLKQHGKPETRKPYSKQELKEHVQQALEMVDLSGTEKKMPAELSGGMRKRAALARLIVYRPKIVLYDEPTTGLDPITAMQINELIVKTQAELKATSIVVTHDVVSALYVSDRLALIRDGRIACIDTPERFMEIQDPIIEFLKKTLLENPRELRKRNHE